MKIVCEKRICNTICFSITFSMGAVSDPIEKSGLTHLIEHLSFRKTKDKNQKQIYSLCESMGVKINATTGKNFLLYSFSCRKECFCVIVKLLADMINELDYTEKDIALEKAIILHELDLKYYKIIDEEINKRWSNENYSNNILGDYGTLDGISLEDIINYKKDLLKSERTIVIVGDYSASELDLVNQLFSQNEQLPTKKSSVAESGFAKPVEVSFEKNKGTLVDVCYSFHKIIENINDAIAVNVLDNALFRGDMAYITAQLREEQGYLYEIDSDYSVINNEIAWAFSFTTNKRTYLNAINQIDLLINSFVLEKQYFDYVKAFYCDNLPMLLDDLNYIFTFTRDSLVLFGETLTPQIFSERVQNISLQEYNNVYKKLLVTKNVTISGNVGYRAKRKIRHLVAHK